MLMNRLRVNDGILSVMDLALLPIGTVIGPAHSRSERFTKSSATTFANSISRAISFVNFDTNGYMRVIAYPEGYVRPELDAAESLAEYKWRFREHMLHERDRHGVSNGAVLAGLRLLGCDDSEMPLGADLPVFAQRDMNRLPLGSLVYTGVPDEADSFAVWQRTDNSTGWARLLGTDAMAYPNATSVPAVLIAVNTPDGPCYDPPAWMASVTDDTVEAFKARAWMVGMKTKATQQWCGTVEEVLASVGVTVESLHGYRVGGMGVGDTISSREVIHLPVDTILSYSDAEVKVIYRRVAEAPVQVGTQRVMAYRTDGSDTPVEGRANYAQFMRIESLPWPVPDMPAPHVDVDLWRTGAWNALPVGTLLCYDRGNYYVKCPDGRVYAVGTDWATSGQQVPERGQCSHTDFALNETSRRMMVVTFP